ncbi:hypothetical protein D5S18_01220 [Nocardia panacis]|uniref:Uncharacterized protein n=2 Tax=Nocardia panacis TaxID=2340916 RepID=A0A3A4K458_9NOCA|nr:hypothetical protein D5S18_01220 [Nocardia panacis]
MRYAEIKAIPPQPWPEDSAEVRRLNTVVAELFPDLATAMAPEMADMADAFICFIGECFAKFAGAEWIEYDWPGREFTFYEDINPALRFDTYDEDEVTAWYLISSMIEYSPEEYSGMFADMSATIREYSSYHDEKRHEEF